MLFGTSPCAAGCSVCGVIQDWRVRAGGKWHLTWGIWQTDTRWYRVSNTACQIHEVGGLIITDGSVGWSEQDKGSNQTWSKTCTRWFKSCLLSISYLRTCHWRVCRSVGAEAAWVQCSSFAHSDDTVLKTICLTIRLQRGKGEVKTRKITAQLALRKCVEIECQCVTVVKRSWTLIVAQTLWD